MDIRGDIILAMTLKMWLAGFIIHLMLLARGARTYYRKGVPVMDLFHIMPRLIVRGFMWPILWTWSAYKVSRRDL